MPITTPQGTLDFKKVDRITFVGASSNTVIDTTTGSLGVGVGVGGPTSNLHVVGNTRLEGDINMLHTSNTASIKLNSNVVTEFPRSKKLIKYPREAIPGNNSAVGSAYTYSASDGDYVIKASSEYDYRFYASNAFDNNLSTSAWLSADAVAGYRYTSGSPITNDSLASSTFTKFGEYGEWIELKLPTSIYLGYVLVYPKDIRVDWKNTSAIVWGSNTGNDGDWQRLSTFSSFGSYSEANPAKIVIDSLISYNYYAYQITGINSSTTQYSVVSELEYYGTPEYDPEAHGVDVVVKSVPNVPNTDWLEVYYDGQDYSADTDFAGTDGVDNKTGVSTYDATPINGVGFDTEYKAFTFDANSSQYLSSSTPISGNYIHTISMWFKGTNLTSTGGDTLMWVGDNTDNKRIEIYIENDLISYNFRDNGYIADTTFQNNRWYHLTCTYNGTQGSAGREIYVDGQRLSAYHSGNLADLNITNSTLNVGGFSGTSTTYMFSGSIANFRLFNRALTSDEIYQLYAYQKEDFGHGDLGMTLKAGRLGIGTSEPRAALDVRGDVILTGNFSQIITGDGRVPIMGRISNTFLTTSPSILISDLPENVDIDRMKTAAYGAIVMMSGDNISSAGKRTPGKYMGFGEVNQSSTYIELAYGFYDGGYTKIVGLRYDIGSSSKSITVKQTFAQYYQGNTTRYDNVSWTTQGSTPGSSTYGVKDLTIFY